MPHANLDGFERLLALHIDDDIEIVTAEVANNRLRGVVPLPPETWDDRWNLFPLQQEVKYRRSVVRLPESGLILLCDDWQGADAVTATWNMHFLGEQAPEQPADFGGWWLAQGAAVQALQQPTGTTTDVFLWGPSNGGREATHAYRLQAPAAATGRFITVMAPRPQIAQQSGSLELPTISYKSGKRSKELVSRFVVSGVNDTWYVGMQAANGRTIWSTRVATDGSFATSFIPGKRAPEMTFTGQWDAGKKTVTGKMGDVVVDGAVELTPGAGMVPVFAADWQPPTVTITDGVVSIAGW